MVSEVKLGETNKVETSIIAQLFCQTDSSTSIKYGTECTHVGMVACLVWAGQITTPSQLESPFLSDLC
jgi:hypothetical protein